VQVWFESFSCCVSEDARLVFSVNLRGIGKIARLLISFDILPIVHLRILVLTDWTRVLVFPLVLVLFIFFVKLLVIGTLFCLLNHSKI